VCGNGLDRANRPFDERRLEEEVLWRISGEDELGKHCKIGAVGLREIDRRNDPFDVALDVTDDGIELAERDSQLCHRPSVAAGEIPLRARVTR
jgi:hypothetical protein